MPKIMHVGKSQKFNYVFESLRRLFCDVSENAIEDIYDFCKTDVLETVFKVWLTNFSVPNHDYSAENVAMFVADYVLLHHELTVEGGFRSVILAHDEASLRAFVFMLFMLLGISSSEVRDIFSQVSKEHRIDMTELTDLNTELGIGKLDSFADVRRVYALWCRQPDADLLNDSSPSITDLEVRNRKLSVEVSGLHQALTEARANNNLLRVTVGEQQVELEDLAVQVKKLQSALETEKSHPRNEASTIRELTSQIGCLQDSLEASNEKLASAQSRLRLSHQETQDARREVKGLSIEISVLKGEVEQWKTMATTMNEAAIAEQRFNEHDFRAMMNEKIRKLEDRHQVEVEQMLAQISSKNQQTVLLQDAYATSESKLKFEVELLRQELKKRDDEISAFYDDTTNFTTSTSTVNDKNPSKTPLIILFLWIILVVGYLCFCCFTSTPLFWFLRPRYLDYLSL